MKIFEAYKQFALGTDTSPNIPTIPRIEKNEGGKGGKLDLQEPNPPRAAVSPVEADKGKSLEIPKIQKTPARLEFKPDTLNGRAVCYLPQEMPERLRGIMPADLRGMGIPMQGLPLALRGISACGWSLESIAGRLEICQARIDARNREGVEGYLKAHRERITALWERWKDALPRIQKIGAIPKIKRNALEIGKG